MKKELHLAALLRFLAKREINSQQSVVRVGRGSHHEC